nr:hypothetical protein [Micromonospora sp. DSM 115978]
EVDRLRGALAAVRAGASVVVPTSAQPDLLEVAGLTSRQIGRVAAETGIALSELTPRLASLEEAFMELTRDDVEYQTGHRAAPIGRAA